ncbi:MAG: TIM barrel protein [Thermomicrobiales bacterium]
MAEVLDSGRASIRIASAPINWGVTRLDPANPLAHAVLDAVVADGYQGCELGPIGYLAGTLEEVALRYGALELELVSAFVATDLARPLTDAFLNKVDTVASLLAGSGAKVLLLSDGMPTERWAVAGRSDHHPETWWTDDDWRRARENVRIVRDRVAVHGLSLAFHPHTGSHVENGREIACLFDTFGDDAPLLCLDTGHILIGGANPVDVLNRYGSRLAHVHAKDIDGGVLERMRAGELSYDQAVDAGLFCDLGDGVVDWDGIRRGIEAVGFTGWVVAEQDRTLTSDVAVPLASHRRNRAFLRDLFGA